MYGNGNVFVCCFVNVVAVALDCTVGAMLVVNTYTATTDQARRCEANAKARITIVQCSADLSDSSLQCWSYRVSFRNNGPVVYQLAPSNTLTVILYFLEKHDVEGSYHLLRSKTLTVTLPYS